MTNGSIRSTMIADKSITTAKLADGAVNATKIADGSVGTNELANDAVTQSKIASKAVGTNEIADYAVGATQLGSNAVTNAKIANSAVTGAKIANSTISTDKLSQRASKQDIQNGTSMRVVCSDVVKQYFDVICPPGMFGFFHATDVPEGWLLCNGATVSRTTYARLFAKIGTKYGSGNGSTTFNLPNLNDRVLQGTTNTGNVGNRLEAALPNITGSIIPGSPNRYLTVGGASGALYTDGPSSNVSSLVDDEPTQGGESTIKLSASKSSSIYNGSKLQPAALQVLPCIRY
ncbi:MAG TPA: tail fiber protein [Candidatus Aphodousia faecavium]|nr:tail fiber protein [Candidatus Aphodousia faecavium]